MKTEYKENPRDLEDGRFLKGLRKRRMRLREEGETARSSRHRQELSDRKMEAVFVWCEPEHRFDSCSIMSARSIPYSSSANDTQSSKGSRTMTSTAARTSQEILKPREQSMRDYSKDHEDVDSRIINA